jgi:hypothetical protein
MADITMCTGTGCPLREQCYRYMAEPSEHWQSFADFTNLWRIDHQTHTPECREFIPLRELRPNDQVQGAAQRSPATPGWAAG